MFCDFKECGSIAHPALWRNKKASFVVYANFYCVNTPILVVFKLDMTSKTCKIPENVQSPLIRQHTRTLAYHFSHLT